ncbi:autotransporter outer membrane beta-barrel domain-containing protein [Rhizobium leguminosarum bv. viciae]|nr:autotransporter outer membrane beta-barrel domain-containing protein [Rhizobium leguminosarum bv. viciae]TBZ77023.1 autotransporter outer membrane beta-barrel domain-containing protein [Rhizobium leguminosarum bv. viciae]
MSPARPALSLRPGSGMSSPQKPRPTCRRPTGSSRSHRTSTRRGSSLVSGGTRQVSSNTSLYGNINFSTSFDGDNYAWNGKLGLRVNW